MKSNSCSGDDYIKQIEKELKAVKNELREYLKEGKETQKNKVVIVSPYKLEEEEINNILNLIPELKDHPFINEINKDIIGGIVIKYGSKIIDLSILNQLKKIKKIMYEIN